MTRTPLAAFFNSPDRATWINTWQIDEVLVTIQGPQKHLWPMMHQDEATINIHVQVGRK